MLVRIPMACKCGKVFGSIVYRRLQYPDQVRINGMEFLIDAYGCYDLVDEHQLQCKECHDIVLDLPAPPGAHLRKGLDTLAGLDALAGKEQHA